MDTTIKPTQFGKELTAMKRKQQGSRARIKTSGTKRMKSSRAGGTLEKVLALIRAEPGIRPSEINRRLRLEQSDGPRATLIKRGLIRKQKEGSVVRYFAV
jgi:hypothetical protein